MASAGFERPPVLILCGDRTLEESAIRHFRNDMETVAKKTIAVTFRLQLTSRFLNPVAYIGQFRIIKIHTWEIKGKLKKRYCSEIQG